MFPEPFRGRIGKFGRRGLLGAEISIVCKPAPFQSGQTLAIIPNLPALSCRSHPEGDDGGGSMLPSKAGCLRQALVGCCLLAAASGCQLHQTGRGFVIQGHPWSLTFDRGCEAETDDPSPCKSCSRNPAVSSADQAAAKPELLPWRSRLKGYRLAGRIFHCDESDDQENRSARPRRPRRKSARSNFRG